MLLTHARALAHTHIYRLAIPNLRYHKADEVPTPNAEDWEPIQTDPNYEPPEVTDCGCDGDLLTDEEETDHDV